MKLLGLDIGTNSVGSSWIDTKSKTVKIGVSVFPAGVEESEEKRGAPKNQERRSQRQQRRSIERRAKLKRRLRQYLIKKNWIPEDKDELQKWESSTELNPWLLRKKAIHEELDQYEFGRVLLHLAQRRGAWWFDEEPEEKEKNKKKTKDTAAIQGTVEYTKAIMKQKGAKTFGELIAIEYENRKTATRNKDKKRNDRIRNRNNAFGEKVSEFVADRHMILDEFKKIWERQKSFGSKLAKQLTNEVKEEIYNKKKTNTWRCKGVLFSQRKAYWNLGTLGRCDLEPTDRKCSKADMYAQEFLVLTSVNNIRITPPGEPSRKLTDEERDKVINAVRKQITASEKTIRIALGINKGANKTFYTLNTEGDKFTVNGDWFYSQIVCGVFGEKEWAAFNGNMKESVNKAILKFNTNDEDDEKKIKTGCKEWWKLDDKQTDNFIDAWKKGPKKDSRVNLSRKAIKNLLPFFREGWSVTEARNMYAEDASNGADKLTRKRYSTKEVVVDKRIRHFKEKHPDLLPPMSDGISNPVVRKSIHEVRRHLMEYIRQYGRPDRVTIELAREARQTEKDIAKRMQKNKSIDALRKEIIETHGPQSEKAIKRVRLCRQQREMCAYSGATITDKAAADGTGLEVDHIVPRSKGGNNSMNNLVLCYSTSNQGKGDRTPIDWLSNEDFRQLELRFKHLKGDKKDKSAVTKDNVDMMDNSKWKNLHRKTPKEGFTEEQLRSTAYAATQTTDWIDKVLYGSEDRGKRYVFASRGDYTGILRRDWGLFFDEDGARSEKGLKNRGDHRHHAVDAAIIAVTAQCLAKIKQSFIDFEEQKENKRVDPQWKTIKQPWEGFSEQLAKEYKKLKVSHRAYNRQIAGYLHKDTLYSPVVIYERHKKNDEKKRIKKGDIKIGKDGKPVLQEGFYVKSINAISLRGSHLRMPMNWASWKKELADAKSPKDRKEAWEKMYSIDAVSPGKSGIVRDVSLRNNIRDWLVENGIRNIDNIKKIGSTKTEELKKYEALIREKGLVINGTPIKKIRLLWKLNEVVEIPRKGFDYKNSPPEKKRKSLRVYQTQNNHHIEIREKIDKNGTVKWSGEVITNFNSARRVRAEKKPIVDRSENENGKFVMSLARGEIVHMRHPDTKEANYFVVFKIDSSKTIHFTPHTDANPATEKKGEKREDISIKPEKTKDNEGLRQLIIYNQDNAPEKVKISPLGDIKLLVRD